MMEVMDILSHSKESLQNDIVFLFNGGEKYDCIIDISSKRSMYISETKYMIYD